MRRALLLVCGLALAGCGKPETPSGTTIAVKTIGPAGGTVVGQDAVANAQVVIPFGALAQETPISLGEDPEPPASPPGMDPVSFSLLCSPEGLEFAKPATLFIPYTGLSNVQLFTARAIPGAEWEPYDGGSPDISENLMRASISHFSRWRVFRAHADGGSTDGG